MKTKSSSSRRREASKSDIIEPFRLHTKDELARRCQVSTRCIENWMREGKIPFLKIGRSVRFSLSRVEESLEKFNREAAETSHENVAP